MRGFFKRVTRDLGIWNMELAGGLGVDLLPQKTLYSQTPYKVEFSHQIFIYH